MCKNKTNRQRLIDGNDDLFREIIRIKDHGQCQKTMRRGNVQVAHFFTRRNLRVRWDEDNACLLNAGVHKNWAHVYIQQFREFWIRRLGERKFDILTLKANYVAPVKEFDLVCTHEQLKKRLEELKSG